MMIKCPVCSKENVETQEFCTLCGTPLKQETPAVKSEPVLPVAPEPAKELSPEDVDAILANEAQILSAANKAGIVMPEDDRQPLEEAKDAGLGDEMPGAAPTVGGASAAPAAEPVSLPGASAPLPAEPRPDAARLTPPAQPSPVPPPATVSTLPPPRSLPAPKTSSRRFSPRCLGFGCVGLLVFFGVLLPAIYFLGLRMPIQEALIRQIEEAVGKTFVVPIYSGPEQTISISQQKVNVLVEPLWANLRGMKDGEVAFSQDELLLKGRWLFLPIEVRTDLRVDGKGNLVVKSLRLNWAANLLFSSAGLSNALTDYVNEEILRPKNLSLLALQLTEGDLFLAYEER
ncbi:MAG: hypothetical protein ACOYYS_04955 [Chloroflexota bacterium]